MNNYTCDRCGEYHCDCIVQLPQIYPPCVGYEDHDDYYDDNDYFEEDMEHWDNHCDEYKDYSYDEYEDYPEMDDADYDIDVDGDHCYFE